MKPKESGDPFIASCFQTACGRGGISMDKCPTIDGKKVEQRLNAEYDAWFARLQKPLDPDDWTERWFDGYTPEQALEDGPGE